MTDLILGIEIGGTKLQLGFGTPSGDILEVQRAPVAVEQGALGIKNWLKQNVPYIITMAKEKYGPVKGLGCGFGGPINSAEGRVLKSIQIEGWQDFPIREWLQDTFLLPALVINDSNAAAWGEYIKGFGSGSEHFFYTNIGSGIGGGFVFGSELYEGQGFGAGEFGHCLVPDWTSETAGAAEEIENLCSGWAIETRLNKPGYVPLDSLLYSEDSQITAADLGQAARKGDQFSLKEIDNVASSIGMGLANVLCLTNVERIAIGGGVSNMGNILIEPIKSYTKKYAFNIYQGKYEISKSLLGDSIVLVGSIILANQFLGIS
jgi:glucokinase